MQTYSLLGSPSLEYWYKSQWCAQLFELSMWLGSKLAPLQVYQGRVYRTGPVSRQELSLHKLDLGQQLHVDSCPLGEESTSCLDEPSWYSSVVILFSHFKDVGYDGISPVTGYINNILNIYFHEYFPRAIEVAQTLRALQSPERFIYTTHPWLVGMYVQCPPNLVLAGVKLVCPSANDVASFTSAVQRGDIVWHRCVSLSCFPDVPEDPSTFNPRTWTHLSSNTPSRSPKTLLCASTCLFRAH
jgi:hypothetical protein